MEHSRLERTRLYAIERHCQLSRMINVYRENKAQQLRSKTWACYPNNTTLKAFNDLSRFLGTPGHEFINLLYDKGMFETSACLPEQIDFMKTLSDFVKELHEDLVSQQSEIIDNFKPLRS